MEAVDKKINPKAATPPENLKKAASSNENWRRARTEVEPKTTTSSDPRDESRTDQKKSDASKRVRIVVEDDSDEEVNSVPYEKLIRKHSESPSREKLKKEPIPIVGDKAYKLVSKFDDKSIIQNLVNKTERSIIDGVTIGELIAMSPEYARELRKTVSKTRQPIKPVAMAGIIGQEAAELPFMEDDEEVQVQSGRSGINVEELPRVDSFFIATEKDIGTEPGGLIASDPVLQYLAALAPGESPQPVYMAEESASLRVVFPVVNGSERVESVVDSGSQIVSMALKIAERMGLMWDPDIQIYMQSANGLLKKSAGLAKNVPFLFGDIPVYLQVHIIDQPAYDVLLGRPFDILTASNIQNHIDGAQTVTIRDPFSNRRCVIPTHARGKFQKLTKPGRSYTADTRERVKSEAKPERQSGEDEDFHSSSRN